MLLSGTEIDEIDYIIMSMRVAMDNDVILCVVMNDDVGDLLLIGEFWSIASRMCL